MKFPHVLIQKLIKERPKINWRQQFSISKKEYLKNKNKEKIKQFFGGR